MSRVDLFDTDLEDGRYGRSFRAEDGLYVGRLSLSSLEEPPAVEVTFRDEDLQPVTFQLERPSQAIEEIQVDAYAAHLVKEAIKTATAEDLAALRKELGIE